MLRARVYLHHSRTAERFGVGRGFIVGDAANLQPPFFGFSVITFQWLEALGLCPPGRAGPFIAAGGTRLDGKVPTNTDGDAINVGRRHGANFCIEAVRQLRGQCGVRQVPGAEVSVWANAVGPFSGAMLLTGS